MERAIRSAVAEDLRGLKMTTVGTLIKDLRGGTEAGMLTGVHGAYDIAPHIVIVARGEKMVLALSEAFKRVNEEMKASEPRWGSVTEGRLPGEARSGSNLADSEDHAGDR